MAVHHWQRLSWPAFCALPSEHLVALLPLGAIEAHGPHLPLGTDILIAEAMAWAGAARLSRRGFDVVLLPALPVAAAPFAASFEGTIDTPVEATTALVSGIARSAARYGARATVIANAHHDPAHVAAVHQAVEEAHATKSATIIFPDLTRRRWAARLTEEFQSGSCHAGRYEGSIVLAVEPDLVDAARQQTLPANPRSLVDAIRRGDRTFAAAGGPQAYFGWPAEATSAEGREIIDRLGAIIEEAVLEVVPAPSVVEGPVPSAVEGPAPEAPPTPDEPSVPDTRLLRVINPEKLGRPRGFSHGMLAPAGFQTLYVAGQTAADAKGEIDRPLDSARDTQGFVAQFSAALQKVIEVVRAAGGDPSHIARMTIYVTDMPAYIASRARLSDVWTSMMGRHYPAIALIEVSGLVDRGAKIEIAADAMLPPGTRR